ncbi:MAG: hypothetical protein IPP34_18575 [Bacteroidetes bacterium]|nr:hypothetical protein [Bacteroidota bacterium]
MAYQGLVGPLLGPQTKSYEELFESWKPMIEAQPQHFKHITTLILRQVWQLRMRFWQIVQH